MLHRTQPLQGVMVGVNYEMIGDQVITQILDSQNYCEALLLSCAIVLFRFTKSAAGTAYDALFFILLLG